MPDPTRAVKFSVVVATYNNELHLIKALRSIFAQEHEYSFEVIIADDGSSDRTQEIIELFQLRYPEYIVPVCRKEKVGLSENLLQVLPLCKGQYTFFLDPDDYWSDAGKVQKQLEFLDKHPEYVFSCHRFNRLFEDTDEFLEDFHPFLFVNQPDGFEFGQERYFDHWLTQLSTMAIRTEALTDIPRLETFKYYWDTQLFWLLLLKGKGYVQPFFGSVYRIKRVLSGTKFDLLKQNSLTYLIIDELRQLYPSNEHIQRIYKLYQKNLLWSKSANKRLLNIRKVSNKQFSIISDDNWGKEVYDAFDIPYLSPFIGLHVFNTDFIKLASNFESYIKKPVIFIPHSQSKHKKTFRHSFGENYPLGLLGNEIELHFVDYKTSDEALKNWNDRVSKINFDNLFFKMDASWEENNFEALQAFQHIQYANKVCFLNCHDKEKFDLIHRYVQPIDYWNPVSEIFFPQSLCSFDLIGWLNGKGVCGTVWQPDNGMFVTPARRTHFFIQFDQSNIERLDARFHPETHQISYSEKTECAVINYTKSDLEYFCLGAQECPHPKGTDLFVDLSEKENRHILVLAKGDPSHQLRVDFIGKEKDEKDTILHIDAIVQPLQEEFTWIHFDFSSIEDASTSYLFSRIRSFYFYLNPKKPARGSLQLMAFYAGSLENFEALVSG